MSSSAHHLDSSKAFFLHSLISILLAKIPFWIEQSLSSTLSSVILANSSLRLCSSFIACCSIVYPVAGYRRHSINTCWINELVNKQMTIHTYIMPFTTNASRIPLTMFNLLIHFLLQRRLKVCVCMLSFQFPRSSGGEITAVRSHMMPLWIYWKHWTLFSEICTYRKDFV